MFRLYCGDALSVLGRLSVASFDAVLCDPPYGLSFMGKEWDRGVPGREVWELVARAIKPGAHLLAFGGTRTFHRLACAIEDAGFEIRDCLTWLHGQGFPKSKELREVGPDWSGYGTALKPAWEPCIVAMKPVDGTFAQNALRHGVAGVNVDGCRIATNSTDNPTALRRSYGYTPNNESASESEARGALRDRTDPAKKSAPHPSYGLGRWPANVVLSHHEDCRHVVATLTSRTYDHAVGGPVQEIDPAARWECVPDCPVRMLDEQSGERRDGWAGGSEKPGYFHSGCDTSFPHPGFGGFGGASRFFYCAKASRGEREAGLREAGLREAGSRVVMASSGRTQIDGEWIETHSTPIPRANHHPTVKPLALCEWLARLILPPARDTPRRLLVPFSGSGSEMIGALRAGWDEVVGIELEAEYVAIARARIAADAPLLTVEEAA